MVVLTRPLFSFKNEALNKLLGSRFTFSNHMTGYERSKAAALLLKEIGANVTPLLRSAALDEKIGGRILIKAESTQLTGSFKFRGAYNKLRILSNNGVTSVITFSSGNHGSAVALAGKLLGITTTVVNPWCSNCIV